MHLYVTKTALLIADVVATAGLCHTANLSLAYVNGKPTAGRLGHVGFD